MRAPSVIDAQCWGKVPKCRKLRGLRSRFRAQVPSARAPTADKDNLRGAQEPPIDPEKLIWLSPRGSKKPDLLERPNSFPASKNKRPPHSKKRIKLERGGV